KGDSQDFPDGSQDHSQTFPGHSQDSADATSTLLTCIIRLEMAHGYADHGGFAGPQGSGFHDLCRLRHPARTRTGPSAAPSA
ncbi:hypothetical protein, partial [Micromonospora ureilytica]|uniref:hypothetical protein n=1 Tax=Micromonospora ureilytica TaxID=709868 RepID=UPI00197CAB94